MPRAQAISGLLLVVCASAVAPAAGQSQPDVLAVIGGSDDEVVFDIAVDANGSAYVVGETKSADLPVTSAFQSTLRGTHDAFVLKLDADGDLVYLTYLGGSGFDSGRGIAVDAAGNAYVTGYTDSTNFPLQDPLDNSRGGFADAFVAKLGPQGNTLLFATYYGGSSSDNGEAIDVGGDGSIYVAGRTQGGLTTINAAQSVFGGVEDAFVVGFNASATAIDYATYVGGNLTDFSHDIAVDSAGRACVAGFSQSTMFPAVNPSQPGPGGSVDGFYAMIAADGTHFVVASLLGGAGADEARGIACNSARLALVGDTGSANFPVGSSAGGALQGALAGGRDGFVATIATGSGAREYSSYIGGFRDDRLTTVQLRANGALELYGDSLSTDLPGRAGPAGLNGAGMFRSIDGGATWQAAGLPRTAINDFAVAPGPPERLIAATDLGLRVSTDDGLNWTPVAGPYADRPVHAVAVNPTAPCTWLIGVEFAPSDGANPAGAALSIDCGANWSAWGPPALRMVSIDWLANGTRIVVGVDRAPGFSGGTGSDNCVINADGAENRCFGRGSSQSVIVVDPSDPCRWYEGSGFGAVVRMSGNMVGCDHPFAQADAGTNLGSKVTALLPVPSTTAGQTLLFAATNDGRIVARDGQASWVTVQSLGCPVTAFAYPGGAGGSQGEVAAGPALVLASSCQRLVEIAVADLQAQDRATDTGSAGYRNLNAAAIALFGAAAGAKDLAGWFGAGPDIPSEPPSPGISAVTTGTACADESAGSGSASGGVAAYLAATLAESCSLGNRGVYFGAAGKKNGLLLGFPEVLGDQILKDSFGNPVTGTN